MKTFYSLIKLSPNPSAGDMLTIGIVVAGKSGVFVRISEHKLKAIHSLISENSVLINFVIKQITDKASFANEIIENNKTLLFDDNHLFNSEYFNYLSKYSNNLLHFSTPIALFDTVTSENVDKLFCLLVDSQVKIESKNDNLKEINFHQKINTNLIDRVKDKVHVNVCFDHTIIPSLYFRFDMDCIGLNGAFTGAKSLSLKSLQTAHYQVSDYITLITEIEKKYNKEKGNNFYLIADEPEQKSKEHNIWEKFRGLKKVKLITSDETEQVSDYIEKSGAKLFLPID